MPTYAQRQVEVKQVANFADDIATSRPPAGVTITTDLQANIDKYNNWKMDIEGLWANGEPKRHLNYVKSFNAQEKKHIIVDTVAKLTLATDKTTVLQALKEAEMEMEDVLSAAADYDLLNYGKKPDWAPMSKW